MYQIHDIVVEKIDDKVIFARILQTMSSQNLVSDRCEIENHYRTTTDVKSDVVDPILTHDRHEVRSHGEKIDGRGGRM
jgi:signal transduction histidine kinase